MMLKQTAFVLLSFNLLTSQLVVANDFVPTKKQEFSFLEKALRVGIVVTSVVVVAGTTVVVITYAPIVVPMAIASAKTGATAAAAKVAAATAAAKAAGGVTIVYVVDAAHTVYTVAEPVIQGAAVVSSIAGSLSTVIVVGQLVRPYVAPTQTEAFEQGIKRNYDTYKKAEKELITCIDKHAYPDRTIVPKACEEIALKYYFHATGKNYYDELMKKNNVR